MTPRAGGTLRVGRIPDLTSLDGNVFTIGNYPVLTNTYDTLTRYDDKYQPQPQLAEKFDLSSDGKKLGITLRKGVQFHSGRELTSEDVKYTALRVRDPKVGAAQLGAWSNHIAEIQTPDKYTAIFTFKDPYPGVFDGIDFLFIVDKATVEGPDAKTKANGSGPFTLVEWVPGQRIRFQKNKAYWKNGRPYLDEILFNIVKDPDALSIQLESGALDFAEGISERDATRLQGKSDLQVLTNDFGAEYHYMSFNVPNKPFDSAKLRQAFNYAIDRKRFVQTVLSGYGVAQATPWPQGSPAYDQAQADSYQFDLEKAKAALQASGATNVRGTLLVNGSFPSLTNQAQIFQADLQKIGITVTVKSLPESDLIPLSNARQFDLISSPAKFANMPSTLFEVTFPFRANNNVAMYTDPKYQSLVKSVTTEPDAAKRKDLYRQLTQIVLDESFTMVLAKIKRPFGARANVRGAAWTVMELPRYDDTWLAG